MTIISVDRLSPPPKNKDCPEQVTRTADVNFDGRQIGTIRITGEGPAQMELLENAKPEDIRNAGQAAMGTHKAPSLYAHVEQLFQQEIDRDRNIRRMRTKLRKSTLFSVPGKKLQLIERPYSESIRSLIKQRHPEAVILNTLSEEDAFRHYLEPR